MSILGCLYFHPIVKWVSSLPQLAQVADGPWREFGSNDDGDRGDGALDADGEDDEGGEGQEEEGGVQNNRPENKSQVQQLRDRFQNTVKLVAHLYCDRTLQDDLRMVSSACRFYMKEYSETLEQQKQGQACGYQKMLTRFNL